MAEKITYQFLPEGNCLTERQLFDYIDKKLDAAEMHAVEKHLLSCEMCSDALEGFEKIKYREKVAAFSNTDSLKNGVEKATPKVIPLNPNRKYYAIAAGIVLIVAVSLYFKMNISSNLESSKTADLVQKDSSVSIMQTPGVPSEKKSDSISVAENKLANNQNLRNENGPAAHQRADGNFGLADTQKMNDGEASGNTFYDRSPVQSNEETFSPVPDALTDRSVLSEPVQPEYKKAEKDASKSEDQKAIAQTTGADDEQDLKTKAPVKNDDSRTADKDKAQGGTGNSKETLHENANVPASPQTAAPYTLSNVSSGSSTTLSTDAIQVNTDSSTTQTPKFYPLKPSDKDLDLSYENGVKMLNSGQATASLAFFDEVIKYPAHHYFEDAQWKKALALIQLNRKPEAKVVLQEIVSKGGKFKTQAEAELKKF
jgi:hypothetical protein